MIRNTGRPARRSIPASTSSSVVGSAQCASSNTTSTRSHPCQAFQAPDQHVEGLLLLTLRAEIEPGVAVAERDRKHGSKQRRILRRKTPRRHDRLQLAEPILRRVRASEPDLAFPSRDDRIQRVVLMMWRAEIPQAEMSLLGQPFRQRGEETRLTDPGLTGQQHHATIAGDRLPPLAQQEFQLLRHGPRSVPACRRTAPPIGRKARSPGARARLVATVLKPFSSTGPRSSISNSRLVWRVRGIAHHDRVRRREALQAGGQMHGFADRHQLPCRAGSHQVADQHKAAGDADAYRQVLRGRRIDDRQARPDGTLGMRLVGMGPAEIDQQAVADDASDITTGGGHGGGDVHLECAEKVAHLLGVELGRERGRADDVAEQNGYLATLGRCGVTFLVRARHPMPSRHAGP